MNHTLKGLVILFSASLASGVCAQEFNHELPELGAETKDYRLQTVSAGMRHADYRRAARNNRAVLGDFAKHTIEQRLTRLGVSNAAAGITATSAQVALGSASVNLNSQKTLFLEVDEAMEQDRAMSVKWRISW